MELGQCLELERLQARRVERVTISRLTLPQEVPTVQFHIAGLMPSGYLSLLFAPAGVGKTRLMAHLAVQTVRPCGEFAG